MTYFREIQHLPLRTYNQGVMAFNIQEDEGNDASLAYLKGLLPEEKVRVMAFFQDVKKRGPEEVKRELIRTMPLQEDGDLA